MFTLFHAMIPAEGRNSYVLRHARRDAAVRQRAVLALRSRIIYHQQR